MTIEGILQGVSWLVASVSVKPAGGARPARKFWSSRSCHVKLTRDPLFISFMTWYGLIGRCKRTRKQNSVTNLRAHRPQQWRSSASTQPDCTGLTGCNDRPRSNQLHYVSSTLGSTDPCITQSNMPCVFT